MGLLRERAAAQGKTLVIRDWVTVNFLPGTAEGVTPSGVLEQPMYLERAGLEPRPVVVTRRAQSVHKSIVANFTHLASLAVDEFADRYLAYAQAVAPFPRIHMESLRAAPLEGAARIAESVGVDPSRAPDMLRDFHEFRRCTGNTTLQGRGGSAEARDVLPPERDAAPTHSKLAEADRLLGYDA
jgi:hypothetical protein